MQDIVQTLPWMKGWRLQASPLTARAWEGSRCGFRTLERAGELSSCNAAASWRFVPGLLASSGAVECDLLASGFRLALPRIGNSASLFAVVVAADVLIGEARCAVDPVLVSDTLDVQEADGRYWVDDPESPALLVVERSATSTRFCLVMNEQDERDALIVARRHLDSEVDVLWPQLLETRREFWSRQDPLSGGRRMLAYAYESLSAYLMPGQGIMNDKWPAARLPSEPFMDLNQLFPMVAAWREMDLSVARSFIESAIGLIGDDGSLPASIHPDGLLELQEAPLPLLAQSLHLVWQVDPRRDTLYRYLPKVAQHLRWYLKRVDPERKGRPKWGPSTQALIPDTLDKDLYSADLPTMLLGEMDAISEMTARLPAGVLELESFSEDYSRIADHLRTFLWDAGSLNFRDRYEDGRHIERVTLSAILPLRWSRLSRSVKENLLSQVRNSHYFMTERGVALWVKWAADNESPPTPALHQILMLDTLQRCDAQDDLSKLRSVVAERLTADYRQKQNLLDDPGAGERLTAAALVSVPDPLCAALALLVWTTPRPPAFDPTTLSRSTAWLERNRSMIGALVTMIILATVTGVVVYTWFKKSMTIQVAETTVGLAKRHYEEGSYDDALRLYLQVEKTSGHLYPIELLIGNTLFRKGQFDQAEEYYRKSLQRNRDNVTASMNLALSIFRQQRLSDAAAAYEFVIDEFGTAYPDLAARAQTAIRVISEDLNRGPAAASAAPVDKTQTSEETLEGEK